MMPTSVWLHRSQLLTLLTWTASLVQCHVFWQQWTLILYDFISLTLLKHNIIWKCQLHTYTYNTFQKQHLWWIVMIEDINIVPPPSIYIASALCLKPSKCHCVGKSGWGQTKLNEPQLNMISGPPTIAIKCNVYILYWYASPGHSPRRSITVEKLGVAWGAETRT